MVSHRLQLLLHHIHQDPGLPHENPTTAYWQLPPHETLENVCSPELPTSAVDFAIIGSGITGCSIAKHLLEHTSIDAASSVCVLEARTLCSGATGRNGGGLASFVPFQFPSMCEHYGAEMAMEIARFTYRTLNEMYRMAESDETLGVVGEVRRTREVMGFNDIATFEKMKESISMLERMVPEANLMVETLDTETALTDLGIKSVGGVLRFNSGAFWPYRFVTRLWAGLLEQYPSRLSIETNTPVTDISFNSDSKLYVLQTGGPKNRGKMFAKNVVHATNAHVGHLVPSLRGIIFPVRSYMSAQEPGSTFSGHAQDRSWTHLSAPEYLSPEALTAESKGGNDPFNAPASDTVVDFGVNYGNQSPGDGVVFWGSDITPIRKWITGDDSVVPPVSRNYLSRVLPTQLTGWEEDEAPSVRELWSGIMGYTTDGLPLVGQLGGDLTAGGVESDGEWICSGFNGAGMCQSWTSGEAVVKMMVGESVEGLIPQPYLMSADRVSLMSMGAEKWIDSVLPE